MALLAGATLAQCIPRWPTLALGACVLAIATAMFAACHGPTVSPSWSRGRLVAACLMGLAWGATFGAWRMQQRWPESASGASVQVEARVTGLPQGDDDGLRFDVEVERVLDAPDDEDAVSPRAGLEGRRLRVAWHGPRPAAPLAPGSRWRLSLRLKPPRGPLNPGGDDAERRSLAQGIAATASAQSPRAARPLAPGTGIDAWRDAMSARIAASLPEGRARFVQALALGDTRALADEDWERLRATGLTHQIAISGFHVGLVAGLGALLARLVFVLLPRVGRRAARPQAMALAAFAAAGGYAALAGFALPTMRTVLMIGAVLLARIARRANSTADALALALVVLVLCDPLSVLSPGFWLSFAGVGWLLWCLGDEHTSLRGRALGFVRAQAVAVVGLLPLSVWFFGQASLPGPMANLVGVPVVSLLVVPASLAGLLLSSAGLPGAEACWHAAAAMMDALWTLLGAMSHWPGAQWWLPEPSPLALLLACIGAFWCLLPRGVPGKHVALLLWLPLVLPDLHRPPPGDVDVEVLDVGHGLAVLVTTHAHALLYDTGPAGLRLGDAGERIVVPALRARGITTLDSLVVSHGDRDHAGGMAAVRRAYPDVRTLGPEGWAVPGMGLCRRGQHWRWDGVDFRMLHPPPLYPYLRNDSSCVLRIATRSRVALLPGDIGRQVEARLVAIEGAALRADLVVAPHHGSRGSSSGDFIDATRPRLVVFGAGWRDRFGSPRDDVVARWRAAGAAVLSTGGSGAVRVRLGPGTWPEPQVRRGGRRPWRAPATDASGYAIGTSPDDR